jgi:hypothetical protein
MTSKRSTGVVLWILALLIMLAAAAYQRRTGPTYPLDVTTEIAGRTVELELPRSGTTDAPVTVAWPRQADVDEVWLVWKRYPSDDPPTRVAFGDDGTAELPVQPAAGKVEYHLLVRTAAGEELRLPTGDDPPVLRYKDPVPLAALLPHVILMFLSMLLGVRAALAALTGRDETRWLVPVTAIGLTLGGMILGPIVQKYAFGAYWTGWPLGGDLTDNKTLLMWAVWAVTAVAFAVRPRLRPRWTGRAMVLAATVVMLAVYLIPHSTRGSQLDYEALESGVDARDAIRTGKVE